MKPKKDKKPEAAFCRKSLLGMQGSGPWLKGHQ
jgi:hypothetical protein